MEYDIIIVGAGPAGLTAALYAVRAGMKTLLISQDLGGTANLILNIENWPGYKGTGKSLMKNFYEQLKDLKSPNLKVVLDDVQQIERKEKEFSVMAEKKFVTKTVILTTGSKRRKLNIPGEKKFEGKGVSYCATCDAFFFRNKTVAVIGGSDCASGSALELAKIAKKVYIIYRKEMLRCENIILQKLEKDKTVKIIYNAVPKEIRGKNKVESLVIDKKGKEKELKLDGIFVEIGSTPVTEFAKNLKLKLDKENQIIVNGDMETSVKGVFAAGDVTNSNVKQVLTASADGAIAAKNAGEFLKKKI